MEGFGYSFITDIDMLIKLRLDYISEEVELSDKDKNRLKINLREYFVEHLPTGDFSAYGFEKNGEISVLPKI